jgi:hypothetical protein
MMDWQTIIYTAIPVVLGVGFIWARIEKVMTALAELVDVITTINTALADKALTKEEVAAVKKEIDEALAAFKAIFKK